MQNITIYEALAQAFAAEGVDTHFTLMGDGNMHWVSAMQKLPGMATFSARHEHRACAMANGLSLGDRQNRRRLGDLRAELYPDHDRADYRGVGAYAIHAAC
jgi:hypothetical protein